ncbi:MAG: DUF4286 family protein [Phycisphaerales bacterium]|jgi:hypothetical protein|nr:DUF4286 family protein [Phycisphaerales bacterium]
MSAISYTVIATFPDAALADEYVAWLEDGHVDAVIEGGAHSAMIVRLTEPAEPVQVETRYAFRSRADFDRYVAHTAPALREDGLRKFGPGRGVRMERRIGSVV